MPCQTHSDHNHTHGNNCGHLRIRHEDHTDYLHDGHLHFVHGDHTDEHTLAVGGDNPSLCTPAHACMAHPRNHTHGPNCGHERVPHGDHVDYRVGDHLHHPHDGHCDHHGNLPTV